MPCFHHSNPCWDECRFIDPCEDRCPERRDREGSRPAFGGLYDVSGQSIAITGGLFSQVQLADTMPRRRVEYTPANSITIRERGVYELNFSILFTLSSSFDQNTQFSVMVRRNGIALPAGVIAWPLEADANSASLSILAHLFEDDEIDLAVWAESSITINLGTDTGAALSVKRIG